MQVRQLNKNDATDYYNLRLEALLKNPEAFLTTYEQEKQKPDPIQQTEKRLDSELFRTFGYFIEDRLSGMVTVIRASHPKQSHKATIVAMYVTQNARGQGGAEALLEEAIRFARTVNVEILQLSVVTENLPAKNLYKKSGFQSYGVEKHSIKLTDKYQDEELMAYFVK